MLGIIEKQHQLIEDFNLLEEWEDKYAYIIEFAEQIPLIDSHKQTENYLVRGCQSKLWLDAEKVNGKIQYYANSEAEIPKGLATLLINVLSGNTPQEIIDADITFLKETEIIFHLSPNRVRGVKSLIVRMKEIAQDLN